MKPLVILSTFLLLLNYSQLQAQVYEQTLSMSQGPQKALSLELANADEKLVADVWKNFMKDFYDAKVKWDRKAKEYFADDVDIPLIGKGNTVDLYATTEQDGSNTIIHVWVDLGGAYLSSREHSAQYTEGEKLLLRFGLEVAREKTRLELEAENDQLRKLQKEMERLQYNKERSQKEIERAQETIKKAEADIVQNEKDQVDMLEKIAEQEKAVEAVKQRLGEL